MKTLIQKDREQFLRIAHAQLRNRYPFKAQRSKYVAALWVRRFNRKWLNLYDNLRN